MKYRDKETIEAVRWDIDTAGGSIASPGDYIIFGYGRIYTRHPEIFEKHFEKAE